MFQVPCRRFLLSKYMKTFVCISETHMPAFHGVTFKEAGSRRSVYIIIPFFFFILPLLYKFPQIGEPLTSTSSRKTRKTNTSSISLRTPSQNWLSGSSSRNIPSSRSLPISFPNQRLMDLEFLKRPSSSYAVVYHRRIRKNLPPAHILSHYGRE